ncbi:hypothetical protein B0H14DRAFT_2619710 [Mycena olivaceomarginata]|nr:hypothetical protein B0H14DRAFT_2619710 [Mycena olivaceomarginata]
MSDDAGVPELIHVVNVTQTYIACKLFLETCTVALSGVAMHVDETRLEPYQILYCLVRYYTLLVLVGNKFWMQLFAGTNRSSVILVTDVWFFADWSESVYALYGCTKTIGAFLLLLIAGFLGVMIAVPILAFDYFRPGPARVSVCGLIPAIEAHYLTVVVEVTGKPSIAGPKFIIAFYASPMAFDIIMTTLTVYKVMDHNRHGGSSSLLNRMVRDGIFYFVAITSLNLKYSNTRGRWVTEIIRESEDPDTIQFTAQSRDESSLPGAPDFDVHPPTPDGILVHFERQVHIDQLQKGGERKSIGRVPPV